MLMITNCARSYRFDVLEDGTWDNRKTFAYIDSGVPDGKDSPKLSFIRNQRDSAC